MVQIHTKNVHLTSTSTFAQSCTGQGSFLALAICMAALGTATAYKFSAKPYLPQEVHSTKPPMFRYMNFSIPIHLIVEAPLLGLAPAISSLIHSSLHMLKKTTLCWRNMIDISAFSCEQINSCLIYTRFRTCFIIEKDNKYFQNFHSCIYFWNFWPSHQCIKGVRQLGETHPMSPKLTSSPCWKNLKRCRNP